jgi:hypothetical protein
VQAFWQRAACGASDRATASSAGRSATRTPISIIGWWPVAGLRPPNRGRDDEIIRAADLCDLVEATLANARTETTQMIDDRKRIEIMAGASGATTRCRGHRPDDLIQG